MDVIGALLAEWDKGLGISTDTRTLQAGDIYFALKGEQFDGNRFAGQALGKGARLVVLDDDRFVTDPDRCIVVPDVLKALQEMASRHRNRFDIPVIAITGTNGKTTTKELLHSVLHTRYAVISTTGNLNNHIGVPLTLLKIRPSHEMAIVEMGASAPGEIGELCTIARPTAGLVTNVGKAHIQGFGSVEAITRTKVQLYDYLLENEGTCFVPEALAENDYVRTRVKNRGIFIRAGQWNGDRIRSVGLLSAFPGVSIAIHEPNGKITEVNTRLFGRYNFENLVNVIAIADHYGLSPDHCRQGLEEYEPANNRSQVRTDDHGNLLVMDAYNANPSSIGAALDHFLPVQSEKAKYLILGDMLELGAEAETEHLALLRRILSTADVSAILVGAEFIRAGRELGILNRSGFRFFADANEAREWWQSHRPEKALVLVKGSRGIALEKIFS